VLVVQQIAYDVTQVLVYRKALVAGCLVDQRDNLMTLGQEQVNKM
jgi:hypothetical protein